MIRGLIFDFDGLILDTEGPEYQSWCEIFHQHGQELPATLWVECIGRAQGWFDPLAHLEGLLGRALDYQNLREQQRRRMLDLVDAQPLLSGVESYVRDAQRLGLRLAIASSGSPDWVNGHLKRLRLGDAWHCVHCPDGVVRAKPEPDLYLAALKALDISAAQAIAFEDSPNGIRAAKRAGLRCVAVPHALTDGLDLSEADVRLSSLSEMPLEKLLSSLAPTETTPEGSS